MNTFEVVICVWYCVFCSVHGQDGEYVYARKNDTLILKCPFRYNQSSSFDVLWIGPPYDNSAVHIYLSSADGVNPNTVLGNRLNMTGDHTAGEYNMVIRNFQTSDAETYRCEYGNQKKYFYVRLVVEVTSVTISSTTLTGVANGSNIQITCTTSESVPPATVRWFLIQQRSSTPKEITKRTAVTKFNGKTISILLYSVQSEDNGGVMYCKAANSEQLTEVQSQNASITVYYGPKADGVTLNPTTRTYTLKEGRALIVLCDAGCNPRCNYNWSKDGVFIQSSNNLHLNSLKRDEAGNYTCIAYNEYGSIESKRIQLIVHYILPVMERNEYTCDKSGLITIICTVSTNMNKYSVLTWEHKISNVTVRFLDGLLSNRNQTELHINICNYQDQGLYVCRVRDDLQITTASSRLEINDVPIFANKDILHSGTDENQVVQFIVEFISYPKPSTVEWYKNTKRLFASEDYQQIWYPFNTTLTIYGKKVKVRGYRASLLLNKPTNEDFGTYRLRLENSEGFAEIELKYEKRNAATNYAAIIGGTVSSFVVVLIVVIAIICILRKCHSKKKGNAERKDERNEAVTSSNMDENNYEGLHLYEIPTT